jgi:hypothetical protein
MNDRSGRVVIFVLLAAVGVGARIWRATKRTHSVSPSGQTIPELAAQAAEELTLNVSSTRTTDPAGRRFLIRRGNGEATLTLYDASKGAGAPDGMTFGRGVLEASDRTKGAAFVAAVAGWLGQETPGNAARQGELRPFAINYVRLGADESWEANKLFLEDGELSAEVFFNVSLDQTRARFVEKDEDYREPLVALLALALRDGRPPRRTKATDPNFASDAPLVGRLSAVAGAEDASTPDAWIGQRWAATGKDAPGRISLWEALDKPPRVLAELPDRIMSLAASPKKDRLAALTVHSKDPTTTSSTDPGEVVLVDLATGAKKTLVASSDAFVVGMATSIVWAPDGRALAVGGHSPGKPPQSITRLYDPTDGRIVDATRPDVDGLPARWDAGGVVLTGWVKPSTDDPAASLEHRTWRWQPGKSEPKPSAAGGSTEVHSPDGRVVVRSTAAALEIAGPAGPRRLVPLTDQRDRAAFDALEDDPSVATWLGPRSLVLASDAEVVLDLETAKLRYLFPEGELRLVSASPDGRRIIARDPNGKMLWAEVSGRAGKAK